MNEEQELREELYITCFLNYLEHDMLTERNWSGLERRFTEATGLDITSGLGLFFKGFVFGMEAAEKAFSQIDIYARENGDKGE